MDPLFRASLSLVFTLAKRPPRIGTVVAYSMFNNHFMLTLQLTPPGYALQLERRKRTMKRIIQGIILASFAIQPASANDLDDLDDIQQMIGSAISAATVNSISQSTVGIQQGVHGSSLVPNTQALLSITAQTASNQRLAAQSAAQNLQMLALMPVQDTALPAAQAIALTSAQDAQLTPAQIAALAPAQVAALARIFHEKVG
jgi:hypothetical protein